MAEEAPQENRPSDIHDKEIHESLIDISQQLLVTPAEFKKEIVWRHMRLVLEIISACRKVGCFAHFVHISHGTPLPMEFQRSW